ncbi:hypothetical protein GC197_16860 [bacterium]|nr:hypothetical protein [bacterium]
MLMKTFQLFGALLLVTVLEGTVFGGTGTPHSSLAGFLSGLIHPWFTVDHLLAMLAIGVLVIHVEKGSIIAVPIVFLTSVLIGEGLEGTGIRLPFGPVSVAATVIFLGTLLIAGRTYSEVMLAIVVAACGVLVGYASDPVYQLPIVPISFLVGQLLGGGLVIVIGMWLGYWIEPSSSVSRCLGGLVALGGAVVLVQAWIA